VCRARFGHFDVVELDNGVSLDFADAEGAIRPQHYGLHSSKSLILSAVEADRGDQER
jgi:hypothetical protein